MSYRYVFLAVILMGLFPSHAHADMKVSAKPLRSYQLPGTFKIGEARIQIGANNTTILSSTVGVSPEESACGIIIADDKNAEILEYRFDGKPTRCLGVIPHPKGGVFVRGDNPIGQEGKVTGFTAFILDGKEKWAIPDQRLVDAQPEPTGTGKFIGVYERPLPVMAYSKKLDKLIAFSVGALNLGMDKKFISQAHVINVSTGQFRVSGQTFGQSGVGIVGGVTERNKDGHFIIYYYSSGARGAFFYSYDGRNKISFFKPRGEDWDDRYIIKMVYQNDLLYLLWAPSDEMMVETRVSVTTDTSAELWTAIFPPQYTFANSIEVDLGRPLTMWVGKNETLVLHRVGESLFLRHLDINGGTFGVGTLSDLIPLPPVAVAISNEGKFHLYGYDEKTSFVSEFTLEFEDKDNYDPEVGPTLPADIGIPADVGLSEVLEAAGCCATISKQSDHYAWFMIFIGLIGLIGIRRKR